MSGGDEEGAGRGLARLAGGLMVDELTNGAVFFSLIVVVAAAITGDRQLIALGVGIGLVGIVVPLLGVRRRWADSAMALVVLAVLTADVATLILLWQLA